MNAPNEAVNQVREVLEGWAKATRQNRKNDDADRDFFVERLGRVLSEAETQFFAWSLMPNH